MICAWCQSQPCPVGGKIILMIGAMLMLWSSNATAQERVVGGKYRADLHQNSKNENNARRKIRREEFVGS